MVAPDVCAAMLGDVGERSMELGELGVEVVELGLVESAAKNRWDCCCRSKAARPTQPNRYIPTVRTGYGDGERQAGRRQDLYIQYIQRTAHHAQIYVFLSFLRSLLVM